MKIKKIVGIAVFLLLAACAGFFLYQQDKAGGTASGGRQSVVDSAGRTVEIPKYPRRVVLLNASNLDLFCAAGGGAFVVGKPTSQALSDEVKAAVAGAAEVGVIHSPNVEKILALKPDLVIGVNVPYHNALIPTLQDAGIPLLVRSLDMYEEVLETLDFYGKLTGREQETQERLQAIEEQYRAAIAAGKGKKAPKNLIVFGSPESFSMGTRQSFVGDLIDRLGGNNIADAADPGQKGAFIPLSMEFVAKQNPEVIFLIMHGAGEQMQQKIQRDLTENAAWSDISAVKNKRVYVLPYALFAVNPGTKVAEAVRVLSGFLYGEETQAADKAR